MQDKASYTIERHSLDKQEAIEMEENKNQQLDKLIDRAGLFLAERGRPLCRNR